MPQCMAYSQNANACRYLFVRVHFIGWVAGVQRPLQASQRPRPPSVIDHYLFTVSKDGCTNLVHSPPGSLLQTFRFNLFNHFIVRQTPDLMAYGLQMNVAGVEIISVRVLERFQDANLWVVVQRLCVTLRHFVYLVHIPDSVVSVLSLCLHLFYHLRADLTLHTLVWTRCWCSAPVRKCIRCHRPHSGIHHPNCKHSTASSRVMRCPHIMRIQILLRYQLHRITTLTHALQVKRVFRSFGDAFELQATPPHTALPHADIARSPHTYYACCAMF